MDRALAALALVIADLRLQLSDRDRRLDEAQAEATDLRQQLRQVNDEVIKQNGAADAERLVG